MTDGNEEQKAALTAPAGQQQLLHQENAERSAGSTDHTGSLPGISVYRDSKAQAHSATTRPSGRKRLRQQLQAAERRLVYLQSWANEQARDRYQHILEAVAEASQAFERHQDLSDAPIGQLADVSNIHAPQTSRVKPDQAHGHPLLHRPLVQERGGSEAEGALPASPQSGDSPQQDTAAQYDTLD